MANITIIGGEDYDTLVDAVSCVTDGGIILVNNDIEGAGVAIFGTATQGILTKSFTIDFNNHTFTCTGPAVGSTGTKTQAFHFESQVDESRTPVNITLKNGTVTSTVGSGVKMLVLNYDNLTIDNMTLDGTNLDGTATVKYTCSNNNGSTAIKNSTIVAAANGVAFDVCGYGVYPNVSVKTENSQINGNVEVTYSNAKREHETSLNLGSGTSVSGKLVSDGNVTKEQVSSGKISIAKSSDVSLTVDSSFGDFAFGDDGKLIDGETKRKQDAEKANSVGAGYSQYFLQQQQLAYIQRQRLLALYRMQTNR